MQQRSAAQIRQHFLDFFARHGHTVVPSAAVIPANDPSLMFTNAGMVPFKDVFVGAEKRSYQRATSSQKCMRVSGKHNDLEEVGRTARHHTFFEMLGNFSFGDYFKSGAIEMAWAYLGELGVPKDRIYVTVFGGAEGIPGDGEARALWHEIAGLPQARILERGMKDNFWAMGDTGPCGPCSEIHFDLRPPGAGEPTEEDFDSGRVTEFWNNVFMQFERQPSGELVALPEPSVDTGMGLERLTAIVQGVESNYDTDLFVRLIDRIARTARKEYRRSDSDDDVSIRVIADHARATAFLVADGIQPSNEGRGYVMRRIMRRAIRHGRRLGFADLFFFAPCLAVVDEMGDAFPELGEAKSLIRKVAETEEQTFRRTLDTGLGILGDEVTRLRAAGKKEIPGEIVFKLYDTYGFPRDLTEVIADEEGLGLDAAGFTREMDAQRSRSRGADVGERAVAGVYKALKEKLRSVEFIGYPHESVPPDQRDGNWRLYDHEGTTYLQAQTRVVAIVRDGEQVERTEAAETGAGADVDVVLNPTPYYGESGGQVGDTGMIVSGGVAGTASGAVIEVTGCQKPLDGLTLCHGRLHGALAVGDRVWAGYDPEVRKMLRAHHSATHLLQGALRKTLGDHVKQQGSLVDADHLRFDYSHFEAPTPDELRAIEDDANRRVQDAHPIVTDVLPFAAAKQRGAIAMFGEKYGDVVRVLTMGESVELCGGTHADNTGDIGMILLTREEAIASGVRRIEAEVCAAALERTRATHQRLATAAAILTGADEAIPGEEPILAAVQKAVRTHGELRDALGEPPAAGSNVSVPPLPEPIGFDAARLVRDMWLGLVQLGNVRGHEAQSLVDALVRRDPGVDSGGLLRAFATLLGSNRDDERRLTQKKSAALGSRVGDLIDGAEDIGGIKLLTAQLDGVEGKQLRGLADELRPRLGSGVLALCATNGDKAALLVAVTEDLTGRFEAGDLVKTLAPIIGGRGGGRPQMAQAGGSKPEAAPAAFAKLRGLIAAG